MRVEKMAQGSDIGEGMEGSVKDEGEGCGPGEGAS